MLKSVSNYVLNNLQLVVSFTLATQY